METNTLQLKQIAEMIDSHQTNGTEMDKITINHPSLTVDEAYEIQTLWSDTAENRGDHMIGWKMGLTSKVKQESVGVKEPIYGRLTQSMEVNHPVLLLDTLIHPRVEPEIAFVMNKEVKGGNVTPKDIWMATEMIMPAIEVIDSRYRNFSFTLEDVVADNASSSRFFLGDQAFSPYHTSLSDVEVTMSKNGEVVQSGLGSAVLGHPVRSIVELTTMINRSGLSIQPGMVILTGGITEAVNVYNGDQIDVDFGPLGKMNIDVR
ncbi:4-oxalocrotonate decarboxylase [Pontibacillus yanchengensis]|uniref:4-oxalocrotonate decarboxylase n=2 Tax=Pontibacillus yanchengensis TaxID=462910 RepID=A0ACC7VCQ7_9BACI|nr:fumarylacetoacetate hydrolase family protein [Pontibacillus yanchengensis]MYL32106.1 4-oxalocrotonate decarboxylase [Pontibacillus yanchengensis]MYL52686.1 4-oxalocrotonate decarboxylase [Pontibacillus yanchengensis]